MSSAQSHARPHEVDGLKPAADKSARTKDPIASVATNQDRDPNATNKAAARAVQRRSRMVAPSARQIGGLKCSRQAVSSAINATHAPTRKSQIGQLARGIERFGFVNPVLIDDAGQIICGQARGDAAKRLGLDQVPMLRVTHLSASRTKRR